MVARRQRRADARLLSRRGCAGAPLLAVPNRFLRGRKRPAALVPARALRMNQIASSFAEPVAATNFSFLRGASPGPNMVLTALLLGYAGIGIADRNTVAGVVRAWAALKHLREDGLPSPERIREGGSPGEYVWIENPDFADLPFTREHMQAMAQSFKLATGTRLVFADGTPDIIVYPANREGWGRLCRLLSQGNLRAEKGSCLLRRDDLLADARDLLLVIMPPRRLD